jgi:hypothetical protein
MEMTARRTRSASLCHAGLVIYTLQRVEPGDLCSAWDLVSVHMLIPAPVAFDMGRPAQLVNHGHWITVHIDETFRRSVSQMYTDIHRLHLQVIVTVV